MTHPATVNAVTRAVAAIGAAVDLGFVFPPRDGETRGRGFWQCRDLTLPDVLALLPKAAAANARGAHVYVRVRDTDAAHAGTTGHPGVIMLDDLKANSVARLTDEGFDPMLTVETSSANFQAWIRLAPPETLLDRAVVQRAIRVLATRFDADPRAVSPVQPGRLPGFTNRKEKYREANGLFPFVRIVSAQPGLVASSASALLLEVAGNEHSTQRRGHAERAPEKGPQRPVAIDQPFWDRLDTLRVQAADRIAHQVTTGRRAVTAASPSEIDFATTVMALEREIDPDEIIAWLGCRRPDKDPTYPTRTIAAASAYIAHKIGAPGAPERMKLGITV